MIREKAGNSTGLPEMTRRFYARKDDMIKFIFITGNRSPEIFTKERCKNIQERLYRCQNVQCFVPAAGGL